MRGIPFLCLIAALLVSPSFAAEKTALTGSVRDGVHA